MDTATAVNEVAEHGVSIGERLTHAMAFKTVFTVTIGDIKLPITETVVVMWIAMVIIVAGSVVLVRRMKEIPSGGQIFLEWFVSTIYDFVKEKMEHDWKRYAPYLGTLFLFLVVTNLIPLLSPIEAFGFMPPFELKPPTRDINVTASLAILSILIVLFSGFRARGFVGWFKKLAHPVPVMIPFNLLEYIIRPLSLALRLFGNILGAFIIMRLVEFAFPLFLPPIFALYFDILDGLIQAVIFTFLTTLFIAEAVE